MPKQDSVEALFAPGECELGVAAADDALGLLYRISRLISHRGCDVDLVLISTEGKKAIDVFHITQGGAKLTELAQHALRADLQRMLGGSDEVDQEYRPAEQSR